MEVGILGGKKIGGLGGKCSSGSTQLVSGDLVLVEKGGEVIPKITGVDLKKRKRDSHPVKYITHCPECNTPLERKDGEARRVHQITGTEGRR